MSVRFKQGVYFYEETLGRWIPIDRSSFLLVFNPGGGTFTNEVIPRIRVVTVRAKDVNGAFVDITSQTPVEKTQHYNVARPYTLSDGTPTYIWDFLSADAIELTIHITDLPTPVNDGMEVPAGFDIVRSWEILVPYYGFKFDENGLPLYDGFEVIDGVNTGYYEVKLSRPTVDNIRHCAVFPYWNPARDGNLRCVIAASGLGSLDLGNIQSVTTTYNPKLTTIPIVCYGYKGTFCMDLGVSKSVSVNYTRVSPENPDNTSADSRLWDNAMWISKLRDLTDRWQMRTNGCQVYLKRPNLERLANGFDESDPMRQYLNEIDGENAYIASAPIKYQTGHPDVISNTMTFTMGTLYPKYTPIDMIEVTFQWEYNGMVYAGRKFVCHFPKGTSAIVPAIPNTWTPIPIPNETEKYYFAASWEYVDEERGYTVCSPDTFFWPESVTDGLVKVRVIEMDKRSQRDIFMPGIYNWSIKPIAGVSSISLSIWTVGGGGGGGGGHQWSQSHTHGRDERSIFESYGSGGGGGASGAHGYFEMAITVLSENDTYPLYIEVGSGGSGGISALASDRTAYAGGNGTRSYVSILGNVVEAAGGKGGSPASAPEKTYLFGQDWLPLQSVVSNGGAGGEGNSSWYSQAGGAGGSFGYYSSGGEIVESGDDGNSPGLGFAKDGYGRGGYKTEESDKNYWDERRIYHSGSGGGGAAYLPESADYSILGTDNAVHAGNGYRGVAPNDGGVGCGGGGGAFDDTNTMRDGGKGGNGLVRILAIGGIIQE